MRKYGVEDEPVAGESVRAGMSIVSFSGDKMLGGPQAGIIAGARLLIDRMRKNPLMRALRVDKSTYAAMEATLMLYDQGKAETEVPVIRAMATTADRLRERATQFAEKIVTSIGGSLEVTLEEGQAIIGAGAAPQVTLPTVLVGIKNSFLSTASLHERLRSQVIPIITRTEKGRILIDLRTVEEAEEGIILDALISICTFDSANEKVAEISLPAAGPK